MSRQCEAGTPWDTILSTLQSGQATEPLAHSTGMGKASKKSIHCSNLILLKRKHTKIMYKKN
jgi:hypothetical protein